MTSHNYSSIERVIKALEHKEPDRVPFDLGTTAGSGIHVKTYKRLLKYLGKNDIRDIEILDKFEKLAIIDDEISDILGIDTVGIFPDFPVIELSDKEDKGYHYYRDRWNILFRIPKIGGNYLDIYQFPLSDIDTIADLKNYKWPSPYYSFDKIEEKIDKWDERENKKALVYVNMECGIFEFGLRLRGFEDFLMDVYSNSKYACYLMDRILELKMKSWERTFEKFGKNIAIIFEGDDLGSQDRPFLSVEIYKKYIKPRHKKLFDFIRKISKKNIYILFHSCGAVYSFIPELIDLGVDILNPVQVSAAGMDTKKLKMEFGNDITFWGGGIDTQYTLPRGSIKEVREEVKKRIEDLAPGGGFIFAPVHNVQPDVPIENLVAMLETLKEYGVY